MEIYLSLLCALAGLLMYGFCKNPKLEEIGRLAFFAGILAFLLGPLPSKLLSIVPG